MPEAETQFYIKSDDVWQAMLADIALAEKSIDIEQYIFVIDSTGLKFLDLLMAQAKKGLKIRILLDMVGSSGFYRSFMPKELNKVGIEVKFFNPIKLWRITNFTSNFFRNHRKTMVIDGKVAYIGGVGIDHHMKDWRDTHMRITGSIVNEITATFEAIWANVSKSFRIRFPRRDEFVKKFELLTNAPRFSQRFVYQALIANIRNAKNYVYLTTPYFIPDIRLYRVLRLAAKRGVDVRLIVPEFSDHLFISYARESYFSLALKAGIKIYNYYPEMMHAKTAIIDDVWATAGSYNLDNLSHFFNHEANVASHDPDFIGELKKHFFADIGHSRELHYDTWIKRPFFRKFMELLTWPFHNVM